MMHVPDVVGFSLGEASTLLSEKGIMIHTIKTTAPPRHKGEEYNENFKVVRLKLTNEKKVELLICDASLG